MFDYEAGDSAVVILIYKVSVFNKLKTNWNTFCTFIKVKYSHFYSNNLFTICSPNS